MFGILVITDVSAMQDVHYLSIDTSGSDAQLAPEILPFLGCPCYVQELSRLPPELG
jgi:hypothetical protein